MKGASNIFSVIVAALIAIGILSFGFYLIKITKANTEKISEEKEKMLKNIEEAYALEKNCREWLNSGGEMYNAEKILNEYKIPTLFKPFPAIYKNVCGKNLENIAYKCLSGSTNGCNGKYISDTTVISNCVQICNKIINLNDNICSLCGSNEQKKICIIYFLNKLGENINNDEYFAEMVSQNIDKACKGELNE